MPLLNSVVDATRAPDQALPVTTTTPAVVDNSAEGIEDSASHDLHAPDGEEVLVPHEDIQPVCELHDHHGSSPPTASPEDTDRPPIGDSPVSSGGASEDTNDSSPGVGGAELIQGQQGDGLPTTRAFVLQQDTAPIAGRAQALFTSPMLPASTLPSVNGNTYVLHTPSYTIVVHLDAIFIEGSVYLHFTLIVQDGQYTPLDAFAGHDHLASDLGFVFGHDVFDSNLNDSASAWHSDPGAIFGDVQYTADDAFGADIEDSVPFESDLGFAF